MRNKSKKKAEIENMYEKTHPRTCNQKKTCMFQCNEDTKREEKKDERATNPMNIECARDKKKDCLL